LPKISEAAWAEIRTRYETTIDPIRDIAASHGTNHVTIWRRAKKLGWVRPDEAPPVPGEADDERLLGRLFRAFDRQIGDLEQRFLAGSGNVEEKDARTLAVLARTFETLARLRGGRVSTAEADDVDLDDLRSRLARRLAALERGGMEGGAADGGDGGGDHAE
jgi:hypothetical protein